MTPSESPSPSPLNRARRRAFAAHRAEHFGFEVSEAGVATVTLNRPERKTPLTFDSYAELRDLFRDLVYATDVRCVILTGAGGNFSSGGDVHEIIGPLVRMEMPELLEFTRMTGDLVLAMRRCPQPVIAAVDGVCAGAGAILSMASDFRLATPRTKVAFLFNRVGLAGCDMGACTMLPRILGQGRASELLYTGRNLKADEGFAWGYFNSVHEPDALMARAVELAEEIAAGPGFAHGITKTMLHQEWSMSIEQAIEGEAQAQAVCMQTQDFVRAYEAFVARRTPEFKGD